MASPCYVAQGHTRIHSLALKKHVYVYAPVLCMCLHIRHARFCAMCRVLLANIFETNWFAKSYYD